MADKPPVLRRPVRAASLTFLGLAVLGAVYTPLMPDVDPSEFFLAGLAYSLVLAVCVVGMVLAGQRTLRRWALAGIGVVVALAGFVAWIFAVGPVPSDSFFRTLPWLLRGLLAVIAAHLAAAAVIAASGWVRFYRPRQLAAVYEPPDVKSR